MVSSMTATSSRVPRTLTPPIQRKNQLSRGLISNSSFLPKAIIRRPQKREMITNTGSMAEMWVGAMMDPRVATRRRFSRPMTWMRKPRWNTSQARGRVM